MVVDAMICPRFMLVAGEESVMASFRQRVQCLTSLFYVDANLLASPRPYQIQVALDVLMLDTQIGITKLKDIQTHSPVQTPVSTFQVEHQPY